MTTPLGLATIALYGASLGLYGALLYKNQRALGWAATLFLAAGIGVHWQALLQRARALDSVPYGDLVGSMSLFAWLLAVTYLALEIYHRQRSVGPFVLPWVLVLMIVASLAAAGSTPPPAPARGARFALHVTLTILAYAAFALSFVMSLIYLIQDHVLRARKPGNTFWRFPPMELLEQMSRTSVVLGTVALLVGIILGMAEAAELWTGTWRLDAKVIASVLTLAIYAAYIFLSRSTAWRGARASWLCLWSFVVVLFSYTVVNLFLTQQHRYF